MAESPFCHECGRIHPLDAPHDVDSKEYREFFFLLNGRYPTWDDAMAHCSDESKALVSKALAAWDAAKRA